MAEEIVCHVDLTETAGIVNVDMFSDYMSSLLYKWARVGVCDTPACTNVTTYVMTIPTELTSVPNPI